MTELLKKDSITFSFDHRLFRGIVSIEISEKETIFHVNYTCPATGEKRDSVIALHRCPSSGENIWESRDVQPISPELLKNLCRRIEMINSADETYKKRDLAPPPLVEAKET